MALDITKVKENTGLRQVQIRVKRPKAGRVLPEPVLTDAVWRIGSVWVNQSTYTPLTREEEEKYLPLIDASLNPASPSWYHDKKRFWANFTIKVPLTDGPIFNITEDRDGTPMDVEDYVKYRFAKDHPKVAPNEDEALKSPSKQFFIYDPDADLIKKHKLIEKEQAAWAEFMRVSARKDGEEVLRRILRIAGQTNPDKLNSIELVKATIVDQLIKGDPDRFLKISKDKNLLYKAEIQEMVDLNILKKAGNTYLYTDISLGDSIEEVVAYMKSAKNSETVAILRARREDTRKTI